MANFIFSKIPIFKIDEEEDNDGNATSSLQLLISDAEPALVVTAPLVSEIAMENSSPSTYCGPCTRFSEEEIEEGDIEYEQKLEDVRELLNSEELQNKIESLMLVDAIQRLGVDYHFQEEIEAVLWRHYMAATTCVDGYSYYTLHYLSLFFRLMRQQGFCIPAG
ncbi:Plastid terpene synthase [Forsythia ovata]|uniref:Plastid terpene synthase n=1 Tax=Forsythia ovata TaxID=205694 RepID=A0ABD1S5Y5_9LAMI